MDGVTPEYCAPERFIHNGTVQDKIDVYSLGITIMMSLFATRDAKQILFGVSQLTQEMSNPILNLVQQTIQYDPSMRPSLELVRRHLEILSPIHSQLSVADPYLNIPDESYPQLLQATEIDLSHQMVTLSILRKSYSESINQHHSMISGSIHDQRESGLCWAFCMSTCIRTELKRLVRKLLNADFISSTFGAELRRRFL